MNNTDSLVMDESGDYVKYEDYLLIANKIKSEIEKLDSEISYNGIDDVLKLEDVLRVLNCFINNE